MAHPYHHALSSQKKWGGEIKDYLPLHQWFDASKEFHPDFKHRALRHHTQGIYEAERVFGPTITNSLGKQIPTRVLGEQHVKEDLKFIPTLSDWLRKISPERWMGDPEKITNTGEVLNELPILKEEWSKDFIYHYDPINGKSCSDGIVETVINNFLCSEEEFIACGTKALFDKLEERIIKGNIKGNIKKL